MVTGVATRAQADAFLRDMYVFDAELRDLIDAHLVCRSVDEATVRNFQELNGYLLAVSQVTIAVEESLAGSPFPLDQAVEPHREAVLAWSRNRVEWLKSRDDSPALNVAAMHVRDKAFRRHR